MRLYNNGRLYVKKYNLSVQFLLTSAHPSSPDGRKRAQSPPFLLDRIIREPFVNRLSRHILTGGAAACCGIPRFY